jgi:hypothetical protein
MTYRRVAAFIWIVSSLLGCTRAPGGSVSTPIPTNAETPSTSSPISPTPSSTVSQSSLASEPVGFEFPVTVDPAKRYLFYLHGKIIEDQGIPAISPDFGEYEYQAILEKLSSYGFVVISQQRSKNTDPIEYAKRVSDQIAVLLNAGVPANHITIAGASKGAWITVYISHFLGNDELIYVIMAICHPDILAGFKQEHIFLHGNVLSIYDSVDEYAGSCQELFSLSEGKGISDYDEIVLHIGTGHGILYKPLDEWITPLVQWAEKP